MRLARATPSCEAPQGAFVTLGAASQDRRTLLKAALGLGLGLSFLEVVSARAEDPRMLRPQVGDQFVFPFGDREGQIITPEDLPLGGPQQLAYPMDPRGKIVRNGSTLNQVVLIRLDPTELTDDTRAHAAEGVVAYSAVCTHQQCPVSMWQARAKALFCACHGSEFDPRDRARVVDGPAPRRLPMLPLKMVGGALTAAGEFTGRVGAHGP